MRRVASVACVVVLLTGGAALAGTQGKQSAQAHHPYPHMTARQLRTNLLIADCLIKRVYEDGSAVTRDAEQAVGCMKRAHVYGTFISRFSP